MYARRQAASPGARRIELKGRIVRCANTRMRAN